MALGSNGSVRLTRAPYVVNKITAKPFAEYLGGSKVASRACALRKFFPEKPVNPSLFALFVCI